MFLRNDGIFDHCTVQKPVHHVIICRCSAAQQSAAMNPHKVAPTPLTNGSYASPHPLCFVLCFPRQTYLSFVLRCEPSPSPPLGRSPLQAVSVSRCSKFFDFQHVACGCRTNWGALPVFHIERHAQVIALQCRLHVGRTPPHYLCIVPQKSLQIFLCVPNLSHNLGCQSNARCIVVIAFKPRGSQLK
jgi:hypothetical protein